MQYSLNNGVFRFDCHSHEFEEMGMIITTYPELNQISITKHGDKELVLKRFNEMHSKYINAGFTKEAEELRFYHITNKKLALEIVNYLIARSLVGKQYLESKGFVI